MDVVLSLEAVERLEAQIAYLRQVDASAAAECLRTRVVLWYRIEHGRILVVSVWHTSQDRFGAEQ